MLTEQILQLVYGSRNFAHDFMDPEYFGGIVFLAALGILEFYFTDADMLNHAKSNCCTSYGTISGTHLIPYREYIRICHLRWRHAGSTVNRIVVAADEFRQYVDVSIHVFLCHAFLQLIANRAIITHFTFGTLHT